MEKAQTLTDNLQSFRESLMNSLAGPYFYVELALITGVITLAWMLSLLIRAQISRALEHHPQKIATELLMKPLVLLAPVLAILGLSVAKPLAERFATVLTYTSIHLLLAFTAARAILLLVRSRVMAYFIAVLVMIIALLDVSGLAEPTREALDSISFSLGKVKLTMYGLVHGAVVLVIVLWLANSMSNLLETSLRRSARLNYNTRELLIKFFRIIVYSCAFLIALSSMGIDLTALAIFGGALGVGVGLGLQKLTSNFVSGVTLLMEKSIKIGDLLEINGVMGWVRQLNIRYALIETPDGRELLIPNEQLISTQVTNWTYSNRKARIEIKVGIAYGSDARRAQVLMMEAVHENKQALKVPSPMCNLREFGEAGLVFQLNFWINDITEGRAIPQSEVMFSILEKFKLAGIEMKIKQV